MSLAKGLNAGMMENRMADGEVDRHGFKSTD